MKINCDKTCKALKTALDIKCSINVSYCLLCVHYSSWKPFQKLILKNLNSYSQLLLLKSVNNTSILKKTLILQIVTYLTH